jgi:hypothetical protein
VGCGVKGMNVIRGWVWYAVWMLFLAVVAVYAVVRIFRNRHDTASYVGYRGVPRWVTRFFGDDENSK